MSCSTAAPSDAEASWCESPLINIDEDSDVEGQASYHSSRLGVCWALGTGSSHSLIARSASSSCRGEGDDAKSAAVSSSSGLQLDPPMCNSPYKHASISTTAPCEAETEAPCHPSGVTPSWLAEYSLDAFVAENEAKTAALRLRLRNRRSEDTLHRSLEDLTSENELRTAELRYRLASRRMGAIMREEWPVL